MTIHVNEFGGQARQSRFLDKPGIPKVVVIELKDDHAVTIDGSAAGFGAQKIYDLTNPSGREWLIVGCVVDLVFTVLGSGDIDDDAATVASIGSAAEATNDTLDGPQADIIASTAATFTADEGDFEASALVGTALATAVLTPAVLTPATYTPAVQAAIDPFITALAKTDLADSDYFTLSDGWQLVLYELDVTGDGGTAGRVIINVSGATTAADVAALIKTAIEANQPLFTLVDEGSGVLSGTHVLGGVLGNISQPADNVADANFLVGDMVGGLAEVFTADSIVDASLATTTQASTGIRKAGGTDVYLNIGVPDADISDDEDVLVNGTVTLTLIDIGDTP